MKTTTYYEVSRNSEYTEDGIVSCEYEENFFKLENAIKRLKNWHVDYIDLDDKLHQWDDKNQKYDIIDNPETCYERSEGEYLGVFIISKCGLRFSDVDQQKPVFIEIDD